MEVIEIARKRSENKGQPFSVRLSHETDLYVDAEARRTARSKSQLVEELTLEAAKLRRFPGITFQGDWPAREAVITGTGFDVWQLCQTIDNYGSIEKVVGDFPALIEVHCRLAQAYRRAYPDEIDARIAENSRPVEELRALYPFVEWEDASQSPR